MRVVRVGVAAILQRDSGAILMGRRKGSHGAGTWSFPGGHLEIGESIYECASRELLEETGLIITPERFRKITFTNDVFENEGKHYITLYVGTIVSDFLNAEVREPTKCDGWLWHTQAPSPLFLPIENLIKGGDNPWALTQARLSCL